MQQYDALGSERLVPKKVYEPQKNVENVEFKEKAVKSYKKQKEKIRG